MTEAGLGISAMKKSQDLMQEVKWYERKADHYYGPGSQNEKTD